MCLGSWFFYIYFFGVAEFYELYKREVKEYYDVICMKAPNNMISFWVLYIVHFYKFIVFLSKKIVLLFFKKYKSQVNAL